MGFRQWRRAQKHRGRYAGDPVAKRLTKDLRELRRLAQVDEWGGVVHLYDEAFEEHYDPRPAGERAAIRRAVRTSTEASGNLDFIAVMVSVLALGAALDAVRAASPATSTVAVSSGTAMLGFAVLAVSIMVVIGGTFWARKRRVLDHGLAQLLAEREAELAKPAPPPPKRAWLFRSR